MQHTPKLDKRILKTRTQLREALISLILERPFDSITIQEVTQAAGVGYRTFFRHYESIEGLLLEIIDGQFDEIAKQMPPKKGGDDAQENGKLLFEYVLDNRELYEVLVRSNRMDWIRPQINVKVKRIVSAFQPDPMTLDPVIDHMVASILAMIRWWLENDRPLTTDEMGQLFADLIAIPTRPYFGLEQ